MKPDCVNPKSVKPASSGMSEMSDRSVEPEWFRVALATQSERQQIIVDDCRINFATWGQVGKPGLILIHGSNAHLEWWRFVAPFLADQFRVAAIDLSGNGDSGWREKYSGDVFAREVFAVCKAAKLGPDPFVIGHSFGGFVTLETGHYYGDRLGGIIMMDFTISPPAAYTEWGNRSEREGPTRSTRIYSNKEEALGRFRLVPDQPCQHPCIITHLASQSLREVEGGWTWKFDPTLFDHLEMGVTQRDKFADLQCRSAVILGADSDDDGAQSADYMSKICAGALPMFNIPGTHHHLMFDEPVAVAMAVKAILLCWIGEDRQADMKAALQASKTQPT
jgi:pimeloyl-ACP methyl ester carboxylesterase